MAERVFVVRRGWDYEGDSIIRIFNTAHEATFFVLEKFLKSEDSMYGDYVRIDEYRIGDHEEAFVCAVARWKSAWFADGSKHGKREWTREKAKA